MIARGLVGDFSTAQEDFRVGESSDLSRDEIEPSGIERELRFVGHAAGDAFAKLSGGCSFRSPLVKRFRVVDFEQRLALKISEENAPARLENARGSFENFDQIGGIREILGDGVNDHRVEMCVRDFTEIIGRTMEKLHLCERVVLFERLDGDLRNIGRPIAFRLGGEA